MFSSLGSCSKDLFHDIEEIHTRAAKIIHGITCDTTDEAILRKAKWDTVSYLYKRKLLIFMQNLHQKRLPYRCSELFDTCKSTTLDLRSGTKFKVPEFRSEIGRHSICYRGPLLLNTFKDDQKEKIVDS